MFFSALAFARQSINRLKKYLDNFTTDKWTDVSTLIAVNTGTQVMDWDATRVTDQGSALDLQAHIGKNASDTAWVLRFKHTTDTVTQGGGASGEIISFGLSADDQTSEGTIPQDCIVLTSFVAAANKKHNSVANDNADMLSNLLAFTHEPAVETIYVEIIRVSATVSTIEFFSDASYTTSIEKQTDGASSSIIDLRYLRVTGFDALNPPAGNVYDGTMDDLAYYDGVIVAP